MLAEELHREFMCQKSDKSILRPFPCYLVFTRHLPVFKNLYTPLCASLGAFPQQLTLLWCTFGSLRKLLAIVSNARLSSMTFLWELFLIWLKRIKTSFAFHSHLSILTDYVSVKIDKDIRIVRLQYVLRTSSQWGCIFMHMVRWFW